MLHYNNIYNYITGLTNSRFVYNEVAGGAAEVDTGNTEAEQAPVNKDAAKEAAAGVASPYPDEALKAAGITELKAHYPQGPAPTIDAYPNAVFKPNVFSGGWDLVKPGQSRAQMEAEANKDKEKPLTHEQEVDKLAERVKDNDDIAALHAMTDKPRPSYEPADEAEYAASEPEAKSTEMAYLNEQIKSPNQIANLMLSLAEYSNAISEAVKDVEPDDTPVKMQAAVGKLTAGTANKDNIKFLDEMAMNCDINPGASAKEIGQMIFDQFKDSGDNTKKRNLAYRFTQEFEKNV